MHATNLSSRCRWVWVCKHQRICLQLAYPAYLSRDLQPTKTWRSFRHGQHFSTCHMHYRNPFGLFYLIRYFRAFVVYRQRIVCCLYILQTGLQKNPLGTRGFSWFCIGQTKDYLVQNRAESHILLSFSMQRNYRIQLELSMVSSAF